MCKIPLGAKFKERHCYTMLTSVNRCFKTPIINVKIGGRKKLERGIAVRKTKIPQSLVLSVLLWVSGAKPVLHGVRTGIQ